MAEQSNLQTDMENYINSMFNNDDDLVVLLIGGIIMLFFSYYIGV